MLTSATDFTGVNLGNTKMENVNLRNADLYFKQTCGE